MATVLHCVLDTVMFLRIVIWRNGTKIHMKVNVEFPEILLPIPKKQWTTQQMFVQVTPTHNTDS